MKHKTMTTYGIKLVTIAVFAAAVVVFFATRTTPVNGAAVADDPATTFKTKCAMCHTPNASKFYDPAVPEADQVNAILKGKKGEKPPYMPGFEAKGMTEDEAKALAAYMKTLRPAT